MDLNWGITWQTDPLEHMGIATSQHSGTQTTRKTDPLDPYIVRLIGVAQKRGLGTPDAGKHTNNSDNVPNRG